MTVKEMALDVARIILRYQAKDLAFRSVLDLYRLRGLQLDWQERVQAAQEEALSSHIFLDRIAELKTVFDAAKPGDDLIRALHSELLHGHQE